MNIRFLMMYFCVLLTSGVMAQSASVSPSRLYFTVPPGEYRTQNVRVTNSGTREQGFNISFGDFEPRGSKGKSELLTAGESLNSAARYLSASPGFFVLKPGESIDVQVIMQVPTTPDANRVKWATMMVRLASERKAPLDAEGQIGMGILQTFQFVVHIFQTPPNITFSSAKINDFKEITATGDSLRKLEVLLENDGEAIIDCASYLEFTNLNTGFTQRLPVRAFTVLPGSQRDVSFSIPADLPKGLYSVLCVLDYGSREAIEAAEIEINVE